MMGFRVILIKLTDLYVWTLFLCSMSYTCAANDSVSVFIDVKNVIQELPERYLSVTIDAGVLRYHWETFDFGSKHLLNLAKGLAPAYLRFGGNDADCLQFSRQSPLSGSSSKYTKRPLTTNFTMTAADYDKLNRFALSAGWQLMFDFNALLRKGVLWDASQAIEILRYSIEQKYTENLAFQLGNEPDLFAVSYKKKISPEQGAADLLRLNSVLRNTLQRKFANSVLVGPDNAEINSGYLPRYLRVLAKDFPLHAITWHQYYMNGEKAKFADFLNPATLDLLPRQIAMIQQQVKEAGLAGTRVWLGETSSAYNSGAPKLSNRYLAGFLWLDKLGISARMGIKMVTRQSFYGGNYSLIDKDLQPLPDYWLSLLYKQLVGNRVFAVNVTDADHKVRVYAHCTHHSRSGYPAGALVIYALNLRTSQVRLRLNNSFEGLPLLQYLLTPHGSLQLKSKQVELNGKLLKMTKDGSLPYLLPMVVDSMVMPGQSFGFYVLPAANVKACLRRYHREMIPRVSLPQFASDKL